MARRKRRQTFDLNADINVVSLIDVMLLLLIIFMITAPMMQGGVDITLPAAEAKPLESKDGLAVTVNQRGDVYIDNVRYSMREFGSVFGSIAANRTQNGVYLRADRSVPYGTVAQLLSIMRAKGVTNIGLVMDAEEIR
jgi:biopolymer transport protein TolR